MTPDSNSGPGPTVSVLTTCYNRAQYLGETIESVANAAAGLAAADLYKQLKLAPLPPSLHDLAITAVGVQFNSITKALSFTCEATLVEEGHEIDLGVTADINPEDNHKLLHGFLMVGDLEFHLQIESEAGTGDHAGGDEGSRGC